MEEGKIPNYVDIKKTNSRFIGPIKIVLYLQLIMIIVYLSAIFFQSQFERVRWRDKEEQQKNSIIVIDDVDYYQSKGNLVVESIDKLLNDTLMLNKMMNAELEMLPVTTPVVEDDPWIINNDMKLFQQVDSSEKETNRDETKEQNYEQNNYLSSDNNNVKEKNLEFLEPLVVDDGKVGNVDEKMRNVDEKIRNVIVENVENNVNEKIENFVDEIMEDVVDKLMEDVGEKIEDTDDDRVEDDDEMEKIIEDMNEKVVEILDQWTTILTGFNAALENSNENDDLMVKQGDKDDNEKLIDTTLENFDYIMTEDDNEKSVENNYFDKSFENSDPTNVEFNSKITNYQLEKMQKYCQDNDAVLGVSFSTNPFSYICIPSENENRETLVVDDDDDGDDDGSNKNKELLFEKK